MIYLTVARFTTFLSSLKKVQREPPPSLATKHIKSFTPRFFLSFCFCHQAFFRIDIMATRDSQRLLSRGNREHSIVITDFPARELSLSTLTTLTFSQQMIVAVNYCCWTLRGTYSTQRVCAGRLPGLHWLAVPPPTRTDYPTMPPWKHGVFAQRGASSNKGKALRAQY